MRLLTTAGLLCSFWWIAPPANAQATAFDELNDSATPWLVWRPGGGMSLTLTGELEVELHDIEGEGGPGHDSVTDTRTVGTRSPTIELDSLWVALRFQLLDELGVSAAVEFDPGGARLSAAWLDGQLTGPGWLSHSLLIGLHAPIVATTRMTERYPLVAAAFWREPEMQAAYRAEARAGDWRFSLAVSLALMRPLDLAPVLDVRIVGGTLNHLAWGAATTFSGNGPVGGAMLRVAWRGLSVAGWGFFGGLAAEAGTDVLASALPAYRALPGDSLDTTAWWAGGRARYDGYGAHAMVEAITSAEGLLRRLGLVAQVGGSRLVSTTP